MNPATRTKCRAGLAASVLVVAAVFAVTPTRADDKANRPNNPTAAQSQHDARVVAQVGTATITVGDLQRRLSLLTPQNQARFGRTPDEIKRGFLEQVLIPELLFAHAAIEQGKQNDREVKAKEREVLRSALMMQVREEIRNGPPITEADIAAHYEKNIERYRSPQRVSVWRIAVRDEETAKKIIAEATSNPTPATWNGLAKAHSLDKTTNMRGGNLGFVTVDGVSVDGKTKIAESVAKAAFALRDGEIAPEPVAEGSGFAVIWRRGAMPASNRSLQEERLSIAETLSRELLRNTFKNLTQTLWDKYVKVLVTDGAQLVEVTPGGGLQLENKPGRIIRTPTNRGRTEPSPSPKGLR